MSTKNNTKGRAQASAQAEAGQALTRAGGILAEALSSREEAAEALLQAVATAREAVATAEGDSPSDRALSASIHAEAVQARAEALSLPADSPAVTKGLSLAMVRQYVTAEGLLREAGVPITPATATAAYRTVNAGRKSAALQALKSLKGWEALTKEARAQAFPETVQAVLAAAAQSRADSSPKEEDGTEEGTEGTEGTEEEAEASTPAQREEAALQAVRRVLAEAGALIQSSQGRAALGVILAGALEGILPEEAGPSLRAVRDGYRVPAEALAEARQAA